MSSNFGAATLTGGQANPETTTNDAVGRLDAALSEITTVDCTTGATLSTTDYQTAFRFNLDPVGASQDLVLPAVKRMVFIDNQGANSIDIVKGSTSIALPSGTSGFFYTDGTTNGLEQLNLAGSQPHDIHVYQPGEPADGAIVCRFQATRAFALPASLTGSVFTAVTAATASTTFTLKKNGSSIGSVAWSAAGTVGTPTFASDVSFAAGDILLLEAPAPADATLADISFDILGNR
jgi:hypothetical protein